MTLTFAPQKNRTISEHNRAIHWQSKRVGLLFHDEHSGEEFWGALEDLREETLDHEGQFISLDLAGPLTETFPEMLYATLKNVRWESSLSFSLPVILKHNLRAATSFINHAILWQRLCDLLILDDESTRATVLVLENIDQASPSVQHEIARLIRFHAAHFVHRAFVFTLARHSHDQIIPELRDMLNVQ